MPAPKKGARLGDSLAYQKLILSNLVAQLIKRCAITTTEAEAEVLRPYIEKLITKAKRNGQHTRRTVVKKIPNKGTIVTLFEELVPAMDSEHVGGYTRLIRVGNHKGDNAPLMRIELVMEKVEKRAIVKAAEKTVVKAVTDEAEKAAETVAGRAEGAHEEGDPVKANKTEEVAVEVGKTADAVEQVTDEK